MGAILALKPYTGRPGVLRGSHILTFRVSNGRTIVEYDGSQLAFTAIIGAYKASRGLALRSDEQIVIDDSRAGADSDMKVLTDADTFDYDSAFFQAIRPLRRAPGLLSEAVIVRHSDCWYAFDVALR